MKLKELRGLLVSDEVRVFPERKGLKCHTFTQPTLEIMFDKFGDRDIRKVYGDGDCIRIDRLHIELE